MANPLYQQYQQGQRSPMAQFQTNRMNNQAVQEGDTNFRDIWNYLKWLKRGYDVYARATNSPTLGEYGRQAWDWATGAGGEGGAAVGSETPALGGAYEAYPTGYESLSGAGAGASIGAEAPALGGAVEAYPVAVEGATAAGAGAGEAAAGMSVGGYASLAAPLIMSYLQYQKGSGRNDPVEWRNEVFGAGKYLSDLFNKKETSPGNYGRFGTYYLDPSYLRNNEALNLGTPLQESRNLSAPETWQFISDRLKRAGGPSRNANVTEDQFNQYAYSLGITPEWLENLKKENALARTLDRYTLPEEEHLLTSY